MSGAEQRECGLSREQKYTGVGPTLRTQCCGAGWAAGLKIPEQVCGGGMQICQDAIKGVNTVLQSAAPKSTITTPLSKPT